MSSAAMPSNCPSRPPRTALSRSARAVCLAALSAFLGDAAAVQSDVIQLKTRGDVTQTYLLLRDGDQAKAVALLFSGGFGLLKIQATESGPKWDERQNEFLLKSRDRLLDQETAVAIVDAPSDQMSIGYSPRFRKSDAHAEDARAIVKDIRTRLPAAKVFLIGNSQGATSAAYVGKALGKDVDDVVMTASVFEWAPPTWRFLHDSNLVDFDFSLIAAPALFVHHTDDRCRATPFSATGRITGKYPLLVVNGGGAAQDNGCGPMGPHGFLGREDEVVKEIKNWLHGRPYRSAIP